MFSEFGSRLLNKRITSLCNASSVYACVVKDWLHAENLLPHQTVEKLNKWTVYDDGGQVRTIVPQNGRGPWESEDPTQEMLESRLISTQVVYRILYNLLLRPTNNGSGAMRASLGVLQLMSLTHITTNISTLKDGDECY